MDRRTFSHACAGALALAAGAPVRVLAQGGAPQEGRDFKRLARPVATASAGQIEVVEFFWYGCPHCFAFEPTLAAWIAGLPADVRFRRVPVGFDALHKIHQRVFYTWEALGLVDQMQMKTFTRFNVQRRPVGNEDDMVAFARESGLDADQVRAAWNSFRVQSRSVQAAQLTDDYGIDQTPEMGIQGRFTSGASQGGVTRMLHTTEWLIDEVRKGA